MDGDALVRDYLDQLEVATRSLAPARRSELRAEVAEHIDAALAEVGTRDEVAVRNVLDRLGRPEEIAEADVDSVGGTSPMTPTTIASPWGAVEILAILFLTLGSVFLPFVGPLVGLVFTWGSRQWTTREKAIGSAIVLVLLGLPMLAVLGFRMLS